MSERARVKAKTEASGRVQVPSSDKGRPETREAALDVEKDKASPRFERWARMNECHEASYLLSRHHLHQLNDKMKFPKFLRLPKGHRRARSKARSEIGPIEGQNEADPATPRPIESTPDLRIGTSTLPTPGPLTLHDQESNGM